MALALDIPTPTLADEIGRMIAAARTPVAEVGQRGGCIVCGGDVIRAMFDEAELACCTACGTEVELVPEPERRTLFVV